MLIILLYLKKIKMAETTFIYKKFLEHIDRIITLTSDERDIFLRKILIM